MIAIVESDRETLVNTGVTTASVRARSPVRAWICRIASSGTAEREIGIGSRPVLVGADGGCDLVLEDPAVSRRHMELTAEVGGVRVRDLGSTNGTFWQGSRLSEAVLPDGASLRVGASVLRITARQAPAVQPSRRTRFGGLVGESAAMREVFAVLELASPTEATVLIEGESGTGKELAARAIHDHSACAAGPFVVVDCGAATESLIDSQLFGHVRGAFTGAMSDRKGAFAEAHGGTLFLDEVGELPLPLQAKLLRAIEARTVQPLGSDRTVQVHVRLIAATNRELHRMVEAKTFRFDLYHRVAVVHLRLPALRERSEDIARLISHFFEGIGVDPGEISGANLEQLNAYGWPGNVRELRNAIERARILSPGDLRFAHLRFSLGPTDAPPPVEVADTSLPFKEAKERMVEQFERRYLAAMFAAHDYNITRAAEQAGINRRHFRELLHKHRLAKP